MSIIKSSTALFLGMGLLAPPAQAAAPAATVPQVKPQAHSNLSVRRFYGYAFDRDSGKYLYTEVHKRIMRKLPDGRRRWLGGTMTYYAPDGARIGIKNLNFTTNRYIPIFRLKLTRPDYLEGISKITPQKVTMYKQKADQSSPDRETVEHTHPMVADSGFDSYVRAHFAELMQHKTLEVTFGIAGRLNSYTLKIHRIGDTRLEGRRAVRFKVELASLLHFVADALTVAYNPDNRRLLQYNGVSNLRDPKTGDPYHVSVDYYSNKPAGAPAKLPPLSP